MKEIVHKIVCDVCGAEHEVDPDVENLLFALEFKVEGGYEYHMDMDVTYEKNDTKMDICSIKCLYDYAKTYYDKQVIADEAAEDERIKLASTSLFTNCRTGYYPTAKTIEEQLIEDDALPPPPHVIENMIATDTTDPILGNSPIMSEEMCNTQYKKFTGMCDDDDHNDINKHIDTITADNPEFDEIISDSDKQDEKIRQHTLAKLNAPITGDNDEEPEDIITLSVPYYMIVKRIDGELYIGDTSIPVPLDTCIQFDTRMKVFPNQTIAKRYKVKHMNGMVDYEVVEVICDPVDYHSNDGAVKCCIFMSKK